MLKNFCLLLISFTIILFLKSCIYDNIETSYPASPCQDTGIAVVSYKNHIVPIIEKRCFPCHGPQGADGNLTVNATFHQQLRFQNIVALVRHDPGVINPMPKGGTKIPDCEIRLIEKWAGGGFQDN